MHERTPSGGASTSTTAGSEDLAPPSAAHSVPTNDGQPARPSGKKLRGVLVVESDPDLQWRLSRMLTVAGNRVVGTSSSDGALALMAHWPVDIALVAEDLPGMDGIELARQIGRDHPSVSVIFMAEEGPDVELAARTAGASAWLIKPFRKEDLDRTIASLRASMSDRPHRASVEVPVGSSPAPPSAE
jgi:CheY-like chemotaxis protein